MGFIPIYIKPYEDELLYSWIYRLAKANHMSVSSFLSAYVKEKDIKSGAFTYDVPMAAQMICENLRVDIDTKALFLKHTSFNFEAMFMEEAYQTKYVNAMFRPLSKINTPLNSLVSTIQYCPECANEEEEPYLHISHQISGVCVCHKHGCQLMEFKGIKGNELNFNEKDYVKDDTDTGDSFYLEYAKYVHALNQHPVNFHIGDVEKLLYNKAKELGCANGNYDNLVNVFDSWKHSKHQRDIQELFKTRIPSSFRIFPTDLVPLLMYFYPNPSDFLTHFNSPCVIETYSCPDCGYKYVATTISQTNGWGCPECTSKLSHQEMLSHVINKTSNGEYQLTGAFESMDIATELYHDKCGEYTQIRPRDFLFQGKRCVCERQITLAEARRTIQNDGRFKLIKFKNTNEPVTIKHNKCGCVYDYDYGHFVHSFNCKMCNSSIGSQMTPEMFAARVKALVGDEYTIIKGFVNQDTKVVLRHNVCGKEKSYWPRTFLDGQRCGYCHKALTAMQLNDLLQKYSNGRYNITRHTQTLYTIQDAVTGNEIKLPPLKIRQEITRPTMSEILPVNKKDSDLEIIDSWDVGYNYLLKYKKEYGHINVPKRDKYLNYYLGPWCVRQRKAHEKGKLKPERYTKLSNIGFDFDPLETEWTRRYEQYKRYIKQSDTTYISRRTDFEGEHLGAWVETQRKMYRDGKMSQERIDKLLLLNPEIFAM